jgi:hypothetical protein
MPCDSSVDRTDTFIGILADINNSLSTVSSKGIIFGGDLNVDVNRLKDKNATRSLMNFCEDLELSVCAKLLPNNSNYTYKNVDGLGVSTLDHFCISQSLVSDIRKFFVEDRGDNLSDHIPVWLHLASPFSPSPVPIANPNHIHSPSSGSMLVNKLRWDKCDLNNYFTATYNHLSGISIPPSCISLSDRGGVLPILIHTTRVSPQP